MKLKSKLIYHHSLVYFVPQHVKKMCRGFALILQRNTCSHLRIRWRPLFSVVSSYGLDIVQLKP